MKQLRLIFAALVCMFSFSAMAQDMPAVRLANLEGPTATVEQILKHPKFNVLDPISVVTEFSISVAIKGGEYVGPFVIKGDKLDENAISLIKKLDKGGQVMIESIHVQSGNNIWTAKPFFLKIPG